MRLSPHFTLEELTVSQEADRRGLDNDPPQDVIDNLYWLAQQLEIVRADLGGHAIVVLSGYRSAEVNRAVGGSVTSAHMRGLAADFVCPGFGSPLEICQRIGHAQHVSYDQLIHEYSWVHLGYAEPGTAGRRQLMTKRKGLGGFLGGLHP